MSTEYLPAVTAKSKFEEPAAVFIYDIETSGLDHRIDQPIEICVIKLKCGVETGRYCSLIKYERPLQNDIVAITGIDDEMLKAGDMRSQAAREIYSFIGLDEKSPDIRICGHNILRFDNFFLRKLFKEQLGILINFGPYTYDTAAQCKAEKLKLTRANSQSLDRFHSHVLDIYAPGIKYNLLEAARYYGVEVSKTAHRAEADAEITMAIYLKQRALNF